MASSFPSRGVFPASEYLQTGQRVLKQDQISAVTRELEGLDGKLVLNAVKEEVGNGHHLVHFVERKKFWDYCIGEPVLEEFVIALLATYICHFSDCRKGKDKYANFLVQWMDFLRKVFHGCLQQDSTGVSENHPVAVAWDKLSTNSTSPMDVKDKNAVGMSIALSVFTYCQQKVVAMKEGKTLLCAWEQSSSDCLEETGVDIDEASLFRLGGYALHSTIKKYEKMKTGEEELAVLRAVKMPLEEKQGLPTNIQCLDKGHMTFMRRELLGYLAMVRYDSFVHEFRQVYWK